MSKFPKIKVVGVHNPALMNKLAKIGKKIIQDYGLRFKVNPTNQYQEIQICFVSAVGKDGSMGMSTGANQGVVFIEIEDPVLKGFYLDEYTLQCTMETFCHEMTHAAQYIYDRKPKLTLPIIDKEDEKEEYFFDPYEVEARILEGFYVSKFCLNIVNGKDLRH